MDPNLDPLKFKKCQKKGWATEVHESQKNLAPDCGIKYNFFLRMSTTFKYIIGSLKPLQIYTKTLVSIFDNRWRHFRNVTNEKKPIGP